MKIYKCDMCGDEFDPDEGMIKGWYTSNRKMRWENPGGSVKELLIEKTMKVYRNIPPTTMLPGNKAEVELDICRACVMKFERP